jgi:hypothetical protein
VAERRPPGFNVDLGFYDSLEVLSIPRRHRAAAVGIWTLCGAYSASKLTDGHVSAEKLKELGCTDAIRDALMATKPDPLWVPGEHVGAIQFTRWTKWQRTCAEVKGYRESEAERKRTAREAARKAATSNNDETSARTDDGQPPDVRPEDRDPKSESESESKKKSLLTLVEGGPGGDPKLPVAAKAASAQGRRLPNDWRPTNDTIQEMRQRFPALDLKLEHEKFTNHWRSQSGAKGRKSDWEATWRNWILRASEQTPRNGRPPPNGTHDDKVNGFLAYAKRPLEIE